MKQKTYLILILVFFSVVTYSQTTEVLNEVALQSAVNTVEELKKMPAPAKKRIISVVPFLSSNGKFTEESKEFTKKYVELLNKEIKKADLNYIVTGNDFDDPEFTNLVYETANISNKDNKFWENFLKKFSPVYIIKGNYKIDEEGNKLYFENVTIYNNWVEESVVNKISVKDASAELFNKYVVHSVFIPGLGQVKRGQKSTGYTIMALSGVTITSAVVMESMHQIMLSKARQNPYSTVYKDNAALFGTLRTVSLIGFGATYIFNIANSIAYKPKNSFISSINFLPYFTNDYYFCSVNIYFNFKKSRYK